MKTAKEYFEEHKTIVTLQYDSAEIDVIEYDDLERILTEHDNEIKAVIDKMIEKQEKGRNGAEKELNTIDYNVAEGIIEASIELLNKFGMK